jgi:hypothetical protein
MGWSLEVSGIPGIAAVATRIITEIADVGWAFRHQDARWLADMRESLLRLPGLLSSSLE